LATLVTTLLATYAWHSALNSLSSSKVTFRQSVAATNVSGLTKYIPGKIWSYALQIYWLDGLGVKKALIVYVNLVNLLISMGVSVMLGLVCLLLSHVDFPARLLLLALLALLVLDIASIWFSHTILNGLIRLTNRVFRRNFAVFDVKRSLLVELHLIHLAAAVTSGLAAYLFCYAIGYRVDLDRALVVIGSSILADVAGFLAIIVPGGLGVREALMYAMLGGQARGSLALVLPVASRMLNMLVEILLGVVALRLLRTLLASKPSPAQLAALGSETEAAKPSVLG
ncbi:MAG TPA: lysylphosphatidylglycerol synthase domain-containing protein, partial [Polyangiaceae bacterium]|nr:lysylphosphatidylglycerol synthase domain-containing protein [Polyangiaceae bacterium]